LTKLNKNVITNLKSQYFSRASK